MKTAHPKNQSHISMGKTQKKLAFKRAIPIASVDRDYGLMHISSKGTETPYPRKTPPVDAFTLRGRLNDHQQHEVQETLSQIDDQKSFIIEPEIRLFERDCPRSSRLGIRDPLHTDASAPYEYLSIGTPHPKKKIELNPHNLIKRLTAVANNNNNDNNDNNNNNKKVSIVSPTQSPNSFFTGSKTGNSISKINFAKRRQDFDSAEYTIAKKGKKMSDVLMKASYNPVATNDAMFHNDKLAEEEIKKHIEEQGFRIDSHGRIISPHRINIGDSGTDVKQTRMSYISSSSSNMSDLEDPLPPPIQTKKKKNLRPSFE